MIGTDALTQLTPGIDPRDRAKLGQTGQNHDQCQSGKRHRPTPQRKFAGTAGSQKFAHGQPDRDRAEQMHPPMTRRRDQHGDPQRQRNARRPFIGHAATEIAQHRPSADRQQRDLRGPHDRAGRQAARNDTMDHGCVWVAGHAHRLRQGHQ